MEVSELLSSVLCLVWKVRARRKWKNRSQFVFTTYSCDLSPSVPDIIYSTLLQTFKAPTFTLTLLPVVDLLLIHTISKSNTTIMSYKKVGSFFTMLNMYI